MVKTKKHPFGYQKVNGIQATPQLIARFTSGLKNVCAELGLIKKTRISGEIKKMPLLERQQIIIKKTGLFEPALSLGQQVVSGVTLGNLINPSTLKRSPIISPFEGIISELADRQLYLSGEKIATIGRIVPEVCCRLTPAHLVSTLG